MHISADVQRITLNASCITISAGRTEQLDIITGFRPRRWLYEWFSQFHSCGTYSVLSRSPSIIIIRYVGYTKGFLQNVLFMVKRVWPGSRDLFLNYGSPPYIFVTVHKLVCPVLPAGKIYLQGRSLVAWLLRFWMWYFSSISLTLLVGRQGRHPSCKKLLVTIWLEICTSYSSSCHHSPPPSCLAPMKSTEWTHPGTSWNSLPRHLRDPSHTDAVFGRLLKTFLFSEY